MVIRLGSSKRHREDRNLGDAIGSRSDCSVLLKSVKLTSDHRGRRGGDEGEPHAVMLLVVDLVGFDPAVDGGRFSPLEPLGTPNHRLFLATH